MSKELGRYDPEMQMFPEPIHEVDPNRASFIRWLKENNRLSTGAEKTDPKQETTFTTVEASQPTSSGLKAIGQYDTTLQMFVQTPQPINMEHLTFMRWLAEKGRLEHEVVGPASGPLTGDMQPGIPVELPSSSE